MSWFHPDNFAEFRDDSRRNEQPVILLQRNDNCFKELCKVFKKAMSWFRSGSFAAFNQDDLGNQNPIQNVISFPLHEHSLPAIQRNPTQNVISFPLQEYDLRYPLPAIQRPKIEVSESERDYINEKYQIDTNVIENFVKLKNKVDILANYKKEFNENANKIKTSTTKIQELIDETNDQELNEVLAKRIKTNPLLQKNEELEILIGELEKEILPLKGIKKNICGICFESEVNCFNKNCGHSFCGLCMKKTTKCASCRIKINPGDICKIF
jgi:hypothetical protein